MRNYLALVPQSVLTEALVANIQIPQVDPEIIGRDVSLLVRVDGYRVYVVRMSVSVDFARNRGNDVILHGHPR